jgi:hypothetical protein
MFERGLIKKPLAFSILASILLFLPIVVLLHPKWNTNDDLGMMMLSKGIGFVKQPTELLLYSNYIYGKYLVIGSKLFSKINFYTFNNIFLLLVSHTMLMFSSIRWNNKLIIAICFILFEFIFISTLAINFQFTITASYCFVAGMVSLLTSIAKPNLFQGLVAALLVLIGAMIRFEQTGLIAVFTFPILCLLFFTEHRKSFIKFGIAFASLFLLNYGLYKANQNYYKTKYNSDFYKDFYKLATLFSDYQLVSKIDKQTNGEFSKQYHFSENDIFLYNHFFIPPKTVLNTEGYDTEYIKSQLSDIKKQFNLNIFKNDFMNVQILFLLTLSILYFLLTAENKKDLMLKGLLLLAYAGYYIAISQLIAIYLKHMPARVLFPVGFSIFYIYWIFLSARGFYLNHAFKILTSKILHFIMPILIMLCIYKLTNLESSLQQLDISWFLKITFTSAIVALIVVKLYKNKSIEKTILHSMFTSLIIFNLVALFACYKQGDKNQKSYELVKGKFQHLSPSKNYYALAGLLQLETISPFDNLAWLKPYHLISSSAFSYNPAVINCFSDLNKDFFSALLSSDYQIICYDDEFMNLIVKYFNEHLEHQTNKIVTSIKISKASNKSYHVYALRLTEATLSH